MWTEKNGKNETKRFTVDRVLKLQQNVLVQVTIFWIT